MTDAKKILVVEDESHLAKGLQFNLEREGYIVSLVDNGESAIELLGEQAFDLMILDESLSALDSLNENEILKIISKFKNEKTIILISHNNQSLKYCDQIFKIENKKIFLK